MKEKLFFCAGPNVRVLEIDRFSRKAKIVWTWRAAGSSLPKNVPFHFGSIDECKPISGGKQVLLCSSGTGKGWPLGGCVLVEYPSGKVRWWAKVWNAHSAELLPANRIVVASSIAEKGNKLLLYDLKKHDTPIFEAPLFSAHGVVWDEKRRRLWALGFSELQSFRLRNWKSKKPMLELERSYPIPARDGHDLQAVPDSSDLCVTTHTANFLFDRDRKCFRPHPLLGKKRAIKSVSYLPDERMVYIQARSMKQWWGSAVLFTNPKIKIPFPDLRLYKARWIDFV